MEYIDHNGFEPLPLYLEEALRGFLLSNYVTRETKGLADELAASGHISKVDMYITGDGFVEIAPKGRHYFDEKAAWEERVAEWQRKEEEREKGERRHDWKLNLASGVYIVIAALLGFILGKVT